MLQLLIFAGFVIVPTLSLSHERLIYLESKKLYNVKSEIDDSDYKLVISFVVFRHGDRTPDQGELDLFPLGNFNDSIFYPFGKMALTNKGKQRAFLVGEYLRRRYNDSISQLYLPNEISVQTTDFARTKMTALVALAAMYPPPTIQRWNPNLNWQPIPYDTMPLKNDDFLFIYTCPRYRQLKNSIYEVPEVYNVIRSYDNLFKMLSDKTGKNIRTPENIFALDNLFQSLNNTGINIPQWIEQVMPEIKQMTKVEYKCSYYNNELIRLSAGVLMSEIIQAINAAIAGEEQFKLRLYSAHEVNVAALLAATKVFEPHQPNYGATVSLELRRNSKTGKYGIMIVYAPEAGGPGFVLPIEGCGGKPVCDYATFIALTKDVLLSRSEYIKQCYII